MKEVGYCDDAYKTNLLNIVMIHLMSASENLQKIAIFLNIILALRSDGIS